MSAREGRMGRRAIRRQEPGTNVGWARSLVFPLVMGSHDLADPHGKIQYLESLRIGRMVERQECAPVSGSVIVLDQNFWQVSLPVVLHQFLQIFDFSLDEILCLSFSSAEVPIE